MRLLRDNGLTIALLAAFLVSLAGMAFSGHAAMNDELSEHGRSALSLSSYLLSSDFLSALFENWESEFLQMAAYVVLTALLFQRGSAESRDPDSPHRDGDDIPSRLRLLSTAGRWLYAHSLGLVLLLLFILSFAGHWLASVAAANETAALHGSAAKDAVGYLGDAALWFESFQNWQSEFLSTAVLVVLSIFLRHRGSPESKPVSAPNEATGS